MLVTACACTSHMKGINTTGVELWEAENHRLQSSYKVGTIQGQELPWILMALLCITKLPNCRLHSETTDERQARMNAVDELKPSCLGGKSHSICSRDSRALGILLWLHPCVLVDHSAQLCAAGPGSTLSASHDILRHLSQGPCVDGILHPISGIIRGLLSTGAVQKDNLCIQLSENIDNWVQLSCDRGHAAPVPSQQLQVPVTCCRRFPSTVTEP